MSTVTISNLPAAGALTGTEVLPIVQSNVTRKTTVQDIANLAGGGLSGTNFVYVAADGTDVQNAAALSAAYTTAQGMSPSATNRITILAAPGYYNFGSTAFTMSTQYIDLVSLDGNRSIIFNSGNAAGTISITAGNIFVKGVDVQTKAFLIGTNSSTIIIEDCKGGEGSFSSDTFDMAGTFIDCEGGNLSFGGNTVNASGIFTRCIAGFNSFGFGASGTFTDCTSTGASFGSSGTASGTFINCTSSGAESFGGGFGIGTAGGTFINCVSGDNSFGGTTASGVFTNCTGGSSCFAPSGTASGTFTECVGGFGSFAGTGTASGTFFRCIGGQGNFGGFGGTFSGTATNCQGDLNSFGGLSMFNTPGTGTLSGRLYYCRLATGAAVAGRGNFNTVSGGGITRLCLTSTNVEDNQG